jgi:hypothetical protein
MYRGGGEEEKKRKKKKKRKKRNGGRERERVRAKGLFVFFFLVNWSNFTMDLLYWGLILEAIKFLWEIFFGFI